MACYGGLDGWAEGAGTYGWGAGEEEGREVVRMGEEGGEGEEEEEEEAEAWRKRVEGGN